MAFATPIFLFYFLPAALLGYYALSLAAGRAGAGPPLLARLRNAFLLVASYVFYAWADPAYVPLLLGVTVVAYVGGRLAGRPGAGPRLRAGAAAVSIGLTLAALAFFKYAAFAQENVNRLRAWFGAAESPVLEIALPMGVSFYTFHAISYLVDACRGLVPPARSFVDFAGHLACFPRLAAGPIVRYPDVAGQLIGRPHTLERFASGAALFVLGFAKKVLLADPVGRVADAAFGAAALTTGDAWVGAAAYAFQLYFDFSGYSDMAVGLGRLFGFEFMRNFDAPYRAESLTDFWRRWHISLSSWLRDYLYIPLGGNRRGGGRTVLNLMIVMLLGGLWHGAAWTFVAWGAYHGAFLVLERALGKRPVYHRLPRPLRIAATFVLVLFSWVLFRSESLGGAVAYAGAMLGGGGTNAGALLLAARLYTPGAVALLGLCALLVLSPWQAHRWVETITWSKALALGALFALALAAMLSQSFVPFLYSRF
jgi:alginate O-acetyltransferase complex protein AlgI